MYAGHFAYNGVVYHGKYEPLITPEFWQQVQDVLDACGHCGCARVGEIDNEFFDRKAGEFRAQQCRIMRDTESPQAANRNYIEEGSKLLELAHKAHGLFEHSRQA